MDLGKIRIDVCVNGDTIQIYNSPRGCSLVINGEVVDAYEGLVAGKFQLKGFVHHDDRDIPVCAEMGGIFMKLYYDGKCIGKKMMAFG